MMISLQTKRMETLRQTLVASSATASLRKTIHHFCRKAHQTNVRSEALNRDFFKVLGRIQGSSAAHWKARLGTQFPNAGYLVKQEPAISASYLKAGEFSDRVRLCIRCFAGLSGRLHISAMSMSKPTFTGSPQLPWRRGRIGNTTMMSTYLFQHLATNDIYAKAAVARVAFPSDFRINC